ncbi:hypothetical protein [Paraburkholderia sp. J41]
MKSSGVAILITVTDDLVGILKAPPGVFPATTRQTCVVQPISNSVDYAS